MIIKILLAFGAVVLAVVVFSGTPTDGSVSETPVPTASLVEGEVDHVLQQIAEATDCDRLNDWFVVSQDSMEQSNEIGKIINRDRMMAVIDREEELGC